MKAGLPTFLPLSTRWILAVALMCQLLGVLFIPVVGDEAYFVTWGDRLSGGYFDHPPLTGWVAYLFSSFPHKAYLLRLFSVAMGLSLFGLLCYLGSRMANQRVGWQLAVAWYVLPVNLLVFGMYLNDTLVSFLSLVFLACTYLSIESERNTKSVFYAVLAGVVLGAGMLTKYLAAMYAISLVVVLLLDFTRYRRFIFTRLPIIVVVSSALFFIHIRWNHHNCDINFAFNLLYSQKGTLGQGVLEYLGSAILVFGPVLVYRLIKYRQLFRVAEGEPSFFRSVFLVSMVVALGSALTKGHFGFHWGVPLSFIGLLAVAESMAKKDPAAEQQSASGILDKSLVIPSAVYGSVVYSIIFVFLFALGSGLLTPYVKDIHGANVFDGFYKDVSSGEFRESLAEAYPNRVPVTEDYPVASMLGINGVQTLFMFTKSKFGRNDDIFVNFAEFKGKDMVVVLPEHGDSLDYYQPYFASVALAEVSGAHGPHPVLLGNDFQFDAYFTKVIEPVMKKFYSHPRPFGGTCYMDKYAL